VCYCYHCIYFYQVQRGISADLKTVTESIRRNCIGLKGVINVPHIGFSGALQNLNQNFRNQVKSSTPQILGKFMSEIDKSKTGVL
jgi:hypothetical protein